MRIKHGKSCSHLLTQSLCMTVVGGSGFCWNWDLPSWDLGLINPSIPLCFWTIHALSFSSASAFYCTLHNCLAKAVMTCCVSIKHHLYELDCSKERFLVALTGCEHKLTLIYLCYFNDNISSFWGILVQQYWFFSLSLLVRSISEGYDVDLKYMGF